jgi:hypothetical protein
LLLGDTLLGDNLGDNSFLGDNSRDNLLLGNALLGDVLPGNNSGENPPSGDNSLYDNSLGDSSGSSDLQSSHTETDDDDDDGIEDNDDDKLSINSGDDASTLDISLESDDIFLNNHGGHIYGSGGEESRAIHTQQRRHMESGHPFYPWKNENELWISNLIYAEMQLSEAAADKLLKGVRDGKLKIEGVPIDSMRQIHKIIDMADYIPVCI